MPPSLLHSGSTGKAPPHTHTLTHHQEEGGRQVVISHRVSMNHQAHTRMMEGWIDQWERWKSDRSGRWGWDDRGMEGETVGSEIQTEERKRVEMDDERAPRLLTESDNPSSV